MIMDIHQVIRKIRVERSQSFDATFLKRHIIGHNTDILRDISAKLVCNTAPWILPWLR
jgi:hypothetical protein